jgi:hypothetical protein
MLAQSSAGRLAGARARPLGASNRPYAWATRPIVPLLVTAHDFGCLALAQHLLIRPDLPVTAAPLGAPADARHINADSGFGPWPYAQKWVVSSKQKMARARRPELESIEEGLWLA